MDDLSATVQEQGGRIAGQAKNLLLDQIDVQSTKVGAMISGHAQDLRTIGDELRRQDIGTAADLADRVGTQIERCGSYLQNADGDRLLGDLEDVARRQPWAVAAGGLVLGLAISRSIKAASTQRYGSRYSGGATR